MTTLLFLFASFALFWISYPLIKKGTALTRIGGDAYLKKRRLKVMGFTLLASALLLLVLAGVTQYYSGESAPPTSDALAANNSSPAGGGNQSLITTRGDLPLTTLPKPKAEQPAGSPTSTNSDLPHPSAPPNTPVPAPDSRESQIDIDLAKINAAIRENPYDARAYAERGNIYASTKDWFMAAEDYQRSLQIDNTNDAVKYNLADMAFVQKKYASARNGFATVSPDSELADVAAYKLFLCDLYGGHQDVAAKELTRFNNIGSNASYYFANIAWSLYNKKPEEARSWIDSAARIYAPNKLNMYDRCLFDLGYLPMAPPPPP